MRERSPLLQIIGSFYLTDFVNSEQPALLQVETAISAPEVAARVDRKSGSQNPPGHGFVRKLLVGELVDSWRPRNGLEDLSTSHRKDALKSHRRVRRRRSRRTAAINDYLKTYEDHFRKVETLEGVLSGPGSTSESMYLRIYKATEPDDS